MGNDKWELEMAPARNQSPSVIYVCLAIKTFLGGKIRENPYIFYLSLACYTSLAGTTRRHNVSFARKNEVQASHSTERKIDMKIVRKKLPLFAPFAVVLLGASCVFAQANQETESRVTMKDLPAPVQAKVKEVSKGAVIRGLSKEVENGQTFYEVELKVKGHNRDTLIDPTGNVVEIEEQVELATLPPEVKSAIIKQAGKGRITMVESISKGDSVVAYEAHVKTAGKMSEIKVDATGKPITK